MTFEHQSKNKYPIIFFLLFCIAVGYVLLSSGSERYYKPNDYIPENDQAKEWEYIENAIAQCNVESVFQAHSKEVSVTLKDGTKISGIEPYIDAIIDRAVAASERCGNIIMATE